MCTESSCVLVQIHVSLADVSTEPECNTQHHTPAHRLLDTPMLHAHPSASQTPAHARDTLGLPHSQASARAVPSASSVLLPPLYLANLWSVVAAQLRSPILRRLLPVKYSQGPQDFSWMTLFGFSTSSFLGACVLSAFPSRLKTQQGARTPFLTTRSLAGSRPS